MKIERKLLSQCTWEDLKRIHPKNRRCEDEDGNSDCDTLVTDRCPYLREIDGEDDCAYFWIAQAETMDDVRIAIERFGDVLVRLTAKEAE